MTDGRLCGKVGVALVRRDGTARCDLTRRSEWAFDILRSQIPQVIVDVDECDCGPDIYQPWCDLIEFQLDGQVMARFVFTTPEPSGSRVRFNGVGLVAQFSKRRFGETPDMSGLAAILWKNDLFGAAAAIEPILLEPELDPANLGPLIYPQLDARASMLDLYDILLAHLTYTEWGGNIETAAVGSELDGPQIQQRWLIDADRPVTIDNELMQNEIAVLYGPDLDQSVTWPPVDIADPNQNCRLQGPALQFPEIALTDSTAAYAVAERAHGQLTVPRPVLTGLDLDPAEVRHVDLIPGRWSVSALPASLGMRFSLASVRIEGAASRVTGVQVSYDAADVLALAARSV